jgi:hypothetical protein
VSLVLEIVLSFLRPVGFVINWFLHQILNSLT